MANKRITYYTVGKGCTPCEEVGRLIEEGKFSSPDADELDMVDIGTDEGFARFAKEVLSKNDGAVPSAYMDGKKCRIEIDGDSVFISCSTDVLSSGHEGIESPPADAEPRSAAPPGLQPAPPESQS